LAESGIDTGTLAPPRLSIRAPSFDYDVSSRHIAPGIILEIAEPARLVFTDAFGEDFEALPESFMTAIVTFEERDGTTELTARARHKSPADRDKHAQMGFHKGWGEMLERLEAHVRRIAGDAVP
jgi:uncharacterized protein YndB with AHSA1/START domain